MNSRNKNIAAGFLGITLGFTFWANDQIFKKALLVDEIGVASLGGRMPASMVIQGLRSGDVTSERSLASVLAEPDSMEKSGRKVASVGRASSPLDNLRFGTLEGKYAITLASENVPGSEVDKVSNIDFIDNPGSEGRPTLITDRTEFIKKHSDLLDIGVAIEKVKTALSGRHIVETYKALARGSFKTVIIQIELDEKDRLYSLRLKDENNSLPGSTLKL